MPAREYHESVELGRVVEEQVVLVIPVATLERIVDRGAQAYRSTFSQLTRYENAIAKPLAVDGVLGRQEVNDPIDANAPLAEVKVLPGPDLNECLEGSPCTARGLLIARHTRCDGMEELIATILIVGGYRLVAEEAVYHRDTILRTSLVGTNKLSTQTVKGVQTQAILRG